MLYFLDSDQLGTLIRVQRRLYDETILSGDARRDLANALDAVTSSVERFQQIDQTPPSDATGTTGGKATVAVTPAAPLRLTLATDEEVRIRELETALAQAEARIAALRAELQSLQYDRDRVQAERRSEGKPYVGPYD